jgi:hypothetical protein
MTGSRRWRPFTHSQLNKHESRREDAVMRKMAQENLLQIAFFA